MGSMIDTLLFQPPKPASYSNTPNFFWLYTALQSKIPAFYINQNPARPVVLFSHSNAEDLGMIYDWFREFARTLDVNVMAYDYTGYGLSEKKPSEEDFYADIEIAFSYLTDVLDKKPSEIILYGRSIGSGPSCHLALKQSLKGEPVCGLILQSALMSAWRVALHFRFTLPGDSFCNIDKLPGIKCPVFVIHGRRDEIVPFWHGQELYLATDPRYRYEPFWVPKAGHNNVEALLRESGVFFAKMREFFDFVEVGPEYVPPSPGRASSGSSDAAGGGIASGFLWCTAPRAGSMA